MLKLLMIMFLEVPDMLFFEHMLLIVCLLYWKKNVLILC